MRLRTQFIITMLLFGIILVAIVASAIITNQQIEKAIEQEKRAVDIAQGAGEIGYLANDYLIYREDLQLKRWQKRFAAFTEEVAGLHVDRPEQQALIANIQANQTRLKEVLESVGSLPRKRDAALDEESLQVSWSRLAVQTQGLVSNASRLSRLLHQRTDDLTYKRTTLIYVMVGLFGVFLLVSYMQTYRRILKSIATLRDGTDVIGSGNLDFVIKETKRDEIGELSYAFNRMTADLKAVTASKADLEREIIERKRAEKRLRESEKKYVKTFQSNPACVGLSRLSDGLVIEANEAMLSLLGYSTDEFIGHTMVQLGVWNDLTDRERMLQTIMTEGRSVNQEYWLRTKKGELLLCNHSAEVIQIGDVPHIIFTFIDITERKRAEEALQASEERYRHLVQHAPTGIYEIDYTTGRFIEVNDAMCLTLGYTRDEILAMTAFDIIDDEGKALFASRSRAERSGEGPSEAVEYPVRTKDGRLIWALLNIMLHRIDGKVTKATVIAHDITERKKAEQALAERTAKLEEINKELESFSYSISHDLRAPLRAIDGYARMLLKKHGHEFDEDSMRKFNVIRSSAQMMGQLIDDILTLSRIGRTKMSIVDLEMEGIIQDVWKEIETINPERNMTLTIQVMPSTYGDRTLIKQVYANLLANAVKFTKYKNPAEIEAGGYTDGYDHVYYVKDNGVGFDMAYYDKLFGIFQRLHNNPDFEGTGVGLATIQRAVHMHGGRVWAEGKVDDGATFYFSLPSSHTHAIDGETAL